jgi:hypothetical protein
MGWWKVRGTESVIGDGPLDAIGDAVRRVAADYQSAFNRRPTKAEWEAILVTGLGHDDELWRPMDECVVKRVSLDVT